MAPLSEGKGWTYDGGLRVALIVRWPNGFRPGSRSGAVVVTPDLYPTLLAAAGVETPPGQDIDGVSLEGVLREESTEREPAFWHYPHYSNQGVRLQWRFGSKQWKLIRFFEDDHVELYDLSADISEETDLKSQEPEQVARLSAMVDRWMVDVSALPMANPFLPLMTSAGPSGRRLVQPLDVVVRERW